MIGFLRRLFAPKPPATGEATVVVEHTDSDENDESVDEVTAAVIAAEIATTRML